MRMRVLAGVLLTGLATIASADGGITLKAIRFPKGLTGTSGSKAPPLEAPLSQVIVFEFTGKPKIGPGIAEGLRIRVAASNTAGQQVGSLAFGTYRVSGNKIIFTPRLPTGAVTASFSTTTNVGANSSLPGMLPATTYEISVPIGAPNSVRNLSKIGKGVGLPLTFETTAIALNYFGNAKKEPVKVKKNKTRPKAGAKGIHPNVFQDPASLFNTINSNRRPPFKLVFNGPVSPSAENINSDRIRLRAIAEPNGAAEDRAVGSVKVLTKNNENRAELLVYPSGLLPLGHTIVLEISKEFESLAGFAKEGGAVYQELATYEIAHDPRPGSAVDDFLYEDFDSSLKQDVSIAASGHQLASWDAVNSDTLKASHGFGGDGSLGRFLPNPDPADQVIYIDTDFQPLPLFNGATPDAPPGTVVVGGVFNFTDFHLPANTTLIARGDRPLIITATGNILIEGVVDLDGQPGKNDDAFDAAIVPMPGGTAGAGGGKGGDAHPLYFPPGAKNLRYIQTPQFAQSGFGPGNQGPGGGGGGQCGCTYPWPPFGGTPPNCGNYQPIGNGSRGSGGGGGSMANFMPDAGTAEPTDPLSGRRGAIGAGNHLPVLFDAGSPIPPDPDAYLATPGNPTNAVARENPNMTFQEAYEAGLVYDAGNNMIVTATWPSTTKILMFGAAGPKLFVDENPDNDFIGPGGEVQEIRGGQGGGGGGTRTEGLSQECKDAIFTFGGYPFAVLDARGGGGGGAGGSAMFQALGIVEMRGSNAKILASGGLGGGGEGTGGSNRGGAGGGGSGGAVILQSAINVIADDDDLPFIFIDVSAGCGRDAAKLSTGGKGVKNSDLGVLQFADGGPGGPGLVQIHVPPEAEWRIDGAGIIAKVTGSAFEMRCAQGARTINPVVNRAKTPTPLTPRSTARSTWYDLGSITSDFRPPVITSAGPLEGPIFGVPGVGPFFRGTDPLTGFVKTDAVGNVIDPFNNDLQVDSPDLGRADYIPNGTESPYYQSVEVVFEGADEDPANPGSPDLATTTGFVSDLTLLNGKRFLRWEVRFDIATNPEVPPTPLTPRQEVKDLRIPFKY